MCFITVRNVTNSSILVPFHALLLLLCCGCDLVENSSIEALEARQSFGEYEATLEPLRTMLDANPNDVRVHDAYGRALLATGQPSLAIWSLRRAAEDPARSVGTGLLLARTLLALHNPNDAELAASRVLASDPSNLDALSVRGRARVAAHRESDALQDLDAVVAQRTEDLQLRLARITALVGAGKLDEVEVAIANAAEIAANQEGGHNLESRFCVLGATFARENQQPELATKRFAQCLSKFPTDVLVVTEFVRYNDGQSNFEVSTEALRAANERAPEDLFVLLNWSRRLQALGRYEEAESVLLETTSNADSVPILSALIDFYTARERWGAAAHSMKTLLGLITDPPPILKFNYADLIVESGDLDKGRRLSSKLPSLFRKLLLGKIELLDHHPKKALSLLEEGLRLWPNNALARDLAGDAAMKIGDIDHAMDSYRESVRNDPGYTRAAIKLARLHLRQGESETAFALIRQFLFSVPNDSEALEIQFDAAVRIKRVEIATESLARLAAIPGQRSNSVLLKARAIARLQGPARALEWLASTGTDLARPINRRLFEFRVEQLLILGRFATAISETQDLLIATPDQAGVEVLLARAHWASGSADNSRSAFKRAIALEADHLKALISLAGLEADEGNAEVALELCERASRLHPEATEPIWAAIQIIDAESKLSEGKLKDLRERLESLLYVDPTHALAAARLAEILTTDPGDLDRALVLARRAARFGAGERAWSALGQVHQNRGEHAQAVNAYARAINRRTDELTLRTRLGTALAANGQPNRARSEFINSLSDEAYPLEREACMALQSLPRRESAEYALASERCEAIEKSWGGTAEQNQGQ